MSLTAGATVGRYQIQGLIGTGGMGEVYKATDSTLGRPVALKVLRPELSGDPERLSRFLHEARAASALNHPNILTIHEVGDHERSRFLVSEFVDGETLRQRMTRGPLTVREILDIVIQAASALSAAHAAGIVHRDIKPDNLMLRPDGYVKVLDFGVATFARSTASRDSQATVAMAEPETGAGIIVGTIAYMSPEQARGLAVDGRSDCYSLGVVLYELLTGRAPFSAPTTTDLLVAILEREPPSIRTIARGLPLQLEWIVEKSLEKDPNLRYQTIADMRVDLQRLKSALESGKLAHSGAAFDAAVGADKSPETPIYMRIFKGVGPVVLVGVFVIGWGFGLYYLFKTKSWDALTRRLPLAICALVILQVGLSTIGSSGAFASLMSIVAVTILLIGTVLPALSGVLLWIGRRTPARMWAAEQLTRGRIMANAVSTSLLDGASGGAIAAALHRLDAWRGAELIGVRRARHRVRDRGARSLPSQRAVVDRDRRARRRILRRDGSGKDPSRPGAAGRRHCRRCDHRAALSIARIPRRLDRGNGVWMAEHRAGAAIAR